METWNDEYRMGEPAAVYQVAEVKERVNPETPLLEKGDEIIDMGADFDFDGFQVVRREFFAHLAEPAVTFNNCRFYVNSACLNKFPDTNFVQVLVNRNTKIMALRPCAENARDSFAWCSISAVTHVTLIGENIGYLCGSPLLFAELGLDAFFGQIPCYFTGRPSTQILLEDVAYYIGFPVKGFELFVLQSEPIWGVAVNIFASFHPLYDGEPLVL